ncbi:MAG: rod shape-determining protein MreC [Synechococcus sp.]
MAAFQWPVGPRWRRVWLWSGLLVLLALVRWSKGAGVMEVYAVLSGPFWPGSAQKEWLQSAELLEQKAQLALLQQDNDRLRRLLKLHRQADQGAVAAAVISRNTAAWWQQLELGSGSIDGIHPGHAVIGPGGLIGRIQSVTPSTARVRLLTAPSSQIGVWVPRTRQHALLVGVGTPRPLLRFLDKDVRVHAGDLVSTSPASTLLPPNVPVAVIQSIDRRAVPAPEAVVQLIASPEAVDWVQVQIR